MYLPLPSDIAMGRRLRPLGILMPIRCSVVSRQTGLPVSVGASILLQETAGGQNWWGHDPTIFVGGFDSKHNHQFGEIVTELAYKTYLSERGTTGGGGMQGVGPVQLTYFSFQDEADRLGGCWIPYNNIYVGFSDLAHMIRRAGLYDGIKAYNGDGEAADEYAGEVLGRAESIAHSLGQTWPPK